MSTKLIWEADALKTSRKNIQEILHIGQKAGEHVTTNELRFPFK